MSFVTGGNERLKINTDGKIQIGTTSTVAKLNIGVTTAGDGFAVVGTGTASPQFSLYKDSTQYGAVGLALNTTAYSSSALTNDVVFRSLNASSNGNLLLTVQNSTGSIKFATGSHYSNDTVKMTIANNGNVSMTNNLSVSGEITAYSSSDIRLKENINPLNNSLSIINKLNPVSYNWNEKAKELNPNKSDKIDVGLIAQELEQVLPNFVHPIYNDDYLSIDYVKLIPYLIGSIKELNNKIITLENK